MNWRDASDFFAMGGYGLYVWGAYGVMLVLMLLEPVLAARRHRAARVAVADDADMAEDEAGLPGGAGLARPQPGFATPTAGRGPVDGDAPAAGARP